MRLFFALSAALALAPAGLSSARAAGAAEPPPPAAAPPGVPLVNLDTPGVLRQGASAFGLDLRGFGGDEGQAYVGLGVRAGVGPGWEAGVRGAFSDRRTHPLGDGSGGAVRHGGSDVELRARYAPPGTGGRVTGLVGIAFPNTPARNEPVLTLGAAAAGDLTPGGRVTGYLDPRATIVQHNSLVGLGIGVRARLTAAAGGPSLVADYTPLISGQNTRDPHDGRRERRDVYGVALRLPLAARSERETAGELEVGYSNATGATTGFSLTPGLGGSGALYVSFAVRR